MSPALSKPTYAAAYSIAREVSKSRADAAGRQFPAPADIHAGLREFARLLWHVDATDGGFIGLTDSELAARVEKIFSGRVSLSTVTELGWAPGQWPVPAVSEQ